MTHIATITDEELEPLWVTNHYDIHLAGLCRYEGKLCYFSITLDPSSYRFKHVVLHTWPGEFYKIYSLTWSQKFNWLFQKCVWELCAGTGYSYSKWYIPSPRWLHRRLTPFYFKAVRRVLPKLYEEDDYEYQYR